MATAKTLSILGFDGQPVPNRFLHPESAIDRLAVLLPGFGYTLDMPLFYYAEHLLLERGWDVLRVEYAYGRLPAFRSAPDDERARWLREDTSAAYRAGLARRAYSRVALIGKSLGTLAMGHLLTSADRPSGEVRAIWLTPLLREEWLRARIERHAGPSLFVIGTADPHYDEGILDGLLAATGGEAVVVEGADHGMDVPGGPVASVRAVERAVAAMQRFLG